MATPVTGLVLLDMREVRPSPDNPRKTLDGIEDLAASINQVGLLQPIVVQRVTDGQYEILFGHRRHAAMRLLAKRQIPAIVRRPLAEQARTRCTGLKHRGMPKLGGGKGAGQAVACGPCWEFVLRADERENPSDVTDFDLDSDLDEEQAS